MIRILMTKPGTRRALFAVSASISLFVITTALAQEPSPAANSPAQPLNASGAIGAAPQPGSEPPTNATGAVAETERIIVTGSNIPTAQEVGPNPVLTINRDLINKSPERNTEELLRSLPVANAQGVAPSNNATGFTAGASTIALRGFDPRATLILIDGRRVAQYPVGIVGIGFVDLNSIPEAAIQSIEILKDGASTTYGADAIAGVVNLKLRKEYHGAEASVEYGNSLDKDSGEFKASVLFGVGDGNTNVTGVINYYHRNSIFARDRGYSQKPPFLSSNASPGNFELSRDAVIEAGGTPVDALDTFFGSPPNFTNGLTPASSYRYAAGRISTFNFSATAGAFPDSERYGGYVNFNHKVLGDQLVIYGDLQYQNVKTHNELAPSPTGDFNTAGSPIIAIPPRTDLNGTTPFGGPTFEETGVPANAFNPFNPFNQIISGGSRYRLAEFGNRLFDNETDAFLTTAGVKGDKLLDGNWGYDSAFRYSQIKNTGFSQTVSASKLNRILNAADPIFDPTSPQFIGTTVPYNPFGDFRNPPPTNAASVAFATVHATDTDISKLATLDLNIYTTELFKLPAGGVGFAFGGQFRRENIDQIPDELNIVGDTVGGSPTSITHGGRKSYAIYVEANIPIFSPTFNFPGFHSLELTAAGRFEAFLNNDTNVAVPKLGLRWQPFDDSVTIRSTWGKGFREPSLYELFANPTASLAGITDPQTGITNPETPTLTVSNPNLAPEDSNAFTAGIVYTPKFIRV